MRGKEFNEIYDLVGIRILVETLRDCYAALGARARAVEARARPVQGLHRDAQVNMYQSLHTTVVGPGRQAARDPDPHARHAPHGASSASPRTGGTRRAASRRATRADLAWLGQMMEWLQGHGRPPGVHGGPEDRPLRGQVFVFTPKGDVVNLPAGATPVDFAYAIHTEVGHRAIGAKVGGRLVPLDYELADRRQRRHPDVEGAGRGAVAGLAAVREDAAGAHEDPPVVRARTSRGRPGARPRRCSSG